MSSSLLTLATSPAAAAAARPAIAPRPPMGAKDGRTSPVSLAALRRQVRVIERGGGASLCSLPLGVPSLDAALPGGGLPLGVLHEISGERAEWDEGAASGFLLGLLARLTAAHAGRVLWIGARRDLYAPALTSFGLSPSRLLHAEVAGEADVLWAMEEGLRCPALAAVVGELGALDRIAGRRLQLAAEAKGVTAFLLRRRFYPARGGEAPSAAMTRWRLRPLPSRKRARAGRSLAAALPLPEAPCWRAELLRCRGAAPGVFDLEWNDATRGFALAAAVCDRSLATAAAAC